MTQFKDTILNGITKLSIDMFFFFDIIIFGVYLLWSDYGLTFNSYRLFSILKICFVCFIKTLLCGCFFKQHLVIISIIAFTFNTFNNTY